MLTRFPKNQPDISPPAADKTKDMLGTLIRDFFGAPAADSSAPSAPERRDAPRVPADEDATLSWTVDSGTDERTQPCRQIIRIRDQSENGVGVLIENELPVGQSVRIVAAGLDEFGVVRHCDPVEDGYFIGVVLVKHEKRRFERKPRREPAILRLTCPVNGRDQCNVIILDSTPYGLRVRASVPIPDRASVQVIHADWQCLGSVSYSKIVDDGCLAGIHLIGRLFTKHSAEF